MTDEDIKHRLARKASYEEGRLAAFHQCRDTLERAISEGDSVPECLVRIEFRVKQAETAHVEALARYVGACQPAVSRDEALKSQKLGIIARGSK